MEYGPDTEGIDHVNIYSKSNTRLGRFLSNFTYAPIALNGHGQVYTIEGLWYYLMLGEKYPELLTVRYGAEAKKLGKFLVEREGRKPPEDYLVIIYCACLQKIRVHDALMPILLRDGLILRHYYAYGKDGDYKIIDKTDTDPMVRIWYQVRKTLLDEKKDKSND